MDAERWERIKELFEEALEREEPERSPFLNQACQNDLELRLEVESLLSGEKNAGDFLQAPVARLPVTKPTGNNPLSTFSSGQIISGRFKVLRFIGHGGMGEVYEAKDLELGERVALKTIRPEIAADPRTMARFKQEIQLARRVTHPNVCRMFDLERHRPEADPSAGVVTFLTMELLEGESLAARLGRVGRIATAEAFPLAQQMAAALAAAHDVGVVHRDFKPGNVMLVRAKSGDGKERAVVTDFGLAKAIVIADEATGEGSTSATASGHIIGTIAYMAPEQLQGRESTPASDIYALGLVMYEMVAGKRLYADDAPLGGARLPIAQSPAPLRVQAPDLDPRWERAILHCLEVDPAKRFATARELCAALSAPTAIPPRIGLRKRRIMMASFEAVFALLLMTAVFFRSYPDRARALWARISPPPLPANKNLVVIPFRALGGRPEEQVYCDGFTETVTTRLGVVPALGVPPALEVRHQHVESIKDARIQLGANLVLTGTWQRLGTDVRVNLALVDAQTLAQLRTRTVDGETGNPLALQDQVVAAAVGILDVHAPESRADSTSQPAAYDDYVLGRGYLQDYLKPENIQNSVSAFNRALKKDHGYALAHAGLGQADWYQFKATNDTKFVVEGAAECQQAVALNSRIPDGHVCLGTFDNGTGKYEKAAQEFQRALTLEPTNADAMRGLASAYEKLNKPADAEKTYLRAIELQPEYWANYNWLGTFYSQQSRLDDAARMFGRVVDLAPDSFFGYSNLGGVYLRQGRYQEAETTLQRSISIRPTAIAYSNLTNTYYFLRRFTDEARTLEQALRLDDSDCEIWGNLGVAYYWAPGERAKSVKVFEKATAMAQERLRVNPRDAGVLQDIADYNAMLGKKSVSLDYLNRAFALTPNDPALFLDAASIYNHFGDTGPALLWMRKALAAGISLSMVLDTPDFDSLRDDPRYQELMRGR
jgi:serine/threonine protein kinase/tetratricopeptide (TPR) repeat protein